METQPAQPDTQVQSVINPEPGLASNPASRSRAPVLLLSGLCLTLLVITGWLAFRNWELTLQVTALQEVQSRLAQTAVQNQQKNDLQVEAIESPATDDWQRREFEVHSLSAEIPNDWRLEVVNMRPEQDPNGEPTGKECADYEIYDDLRTVVVHVRPWCGFGESVPDPWTEDAEIVKTLEPNKFLVRSDTSSGFQYATGYEVNGQRTELHHTLNLNPDEDIFGNVFVSFSGSADEKEKVTVITDRIVSSLQ